VHIRVVNESKRILVSCCQSCRFNTQAAPRRGAAQYKMITYDIRRKQHNAKNKQCALRVVKYWMGRCPGEKHLISSVRPLQVPPGNEELHERAGCNPADGCHRLHKGASRRMCHIDPAPVSHPLPPQRSRLQGPPWAMSPAPAPQPEGDGLQPACSPRSHLLEGGGRYCT